jgi:GNAT superfamily N-acetyltransferase
VRTYPIAEVSRRENPPGWDFDLREPDGTLVGHAIVAEPVGGTSMLRLLVVEPQRRGRGLGRAMGEQALALLAHTGARELVALLDEPGADTGGEDTEAAQHLLHGLGFSDRGPLCSFTRTPAP